MRRLPALFAVTALAVAGLAGCSASGSDASSCPRPSIDASSLDSIQVSGAADAAPEVTIPTPFHASSTKAQDLVVGEGTAVTDPSQLAYLDLTLTSGETGEPLIATPYDGNATRVFPLTQWFSTFPGLELALDCATSGSRVVVAFGPDGIEEQTAAGLGLAPGESAVAVVDLHEVYLEKADGADQFVDGRGLPTVVRAPDGRPGIIVPETDAPTEATSAVLKRGDGATVEAGRTVRVHYTAVNWDDRTVADSTWGAEPASATLESLPPALANALEGQTVGSQVLVVIPAEEAGSAGTAVVYVLDILGIDEA